MSKASTAHSAGRKAYVITGPTSGIGWHTALELAKHGTVILVGRNREKLEGVRKTIESKGGQATCVVCDLSDMTSIPRAAAEIAALQLPIAGVINNAGIMEITPTKNAQGWDNCFATNHLGPFAFTEALMPHLADGAQVLFVASGVEDPERKLAAMAGFRGGRYISAEASARGEWQPNGATLAGGDAYASSKQAILAATLGFARETTRLRFNAVEPGFNPATNLGHRDVNVVVRLLAKYLMGPIAPMIKGGSTPPRAGRMITKVITDTSGATGVYYDERGNPMRGSKVAHDPKFQDRVMAETRALLASTLPSARSASPR